jgi:hypothetical protein
MKKSFVKVSLFLSIVVMVSATASAQGKPVVKQENKAKTTEANVRHEVKTAPAGAAVSNNKVKTAAVGSSSSKEVVGKPLAPAK